MARGATRMEKDSMGEMSVPESALYGASTQRALLNFPISGYRFSRPFIRALGLIKWSAAQANHDLGLLDDHRAALIVQAAEEVVDGKLDEHFPLDIFQTGSGTSTNTNANEVIANRCAQLAGKPIGSREVVHPNDHVNMGQSSNDVIPSAIHVSAAEQLKNRLVPALETPAPAGGRAEAAELREQLRLAVETENFELAAELRDRLRVIGMIDLSLLTDGGVGWLDASGPASHLVLSTRIRLARNLSDHVFQGRNSETEREEILSTVEQAARETVLLKRATKFRLDRLDRIDRQLLHERHLVSKELAGLDADGAGPIGRHASGPGPDRRDAERGGPPPDPGAPFGVRSGRGLRRGRPAGRRTGTTTCFRISP